MGKVWESMGEEIIGNTLWENEGRAMKVVLVDRGGNVRETYEGKMGAMKKRENKGL